MKKNKIFSFILSLATICNFTLAQAQDNNEKDLKNTIVLANKDKRIYRCLYCETKVEKK
jgi:aspartate carbamoyltransferase regulatory subunit